MCAITDVQKIMYWALKGREGNVVDDFCEVTFSTLLQRILLERLS